VPAADLARAATDRSGVRRILAGTRSPHKLAELRQLLDLDGVDLVSLDDLGILGDPVEDGATFADNAIIKARWGAERAGLPTLADDSGIEVKALGGGPGVHTKRYAGEAATDAANNQKLLTELDALGARSPDVRGARYVCVLAFVDPDRLGAPILAEGTFVGRIAAAPRGSGGFGYDPIFEPDVERPGGRTVGQMSQAEKNAVSHRAKAAAAMADALRRLGY
jgi:XTP/dITP diphosphohydrolase